MRPSCLAAAFATLLVAPLARAQSTPSPVMPQEAFYRRAPEPPQSSWAVYGLEGAELEIRGGALAPDSVSPVLAPNLYPGTRVANGDILSGVEKPYGVDPFALSFQAGYRFLPFFSAGAFFDFASSFSMKDGTDTAYSDSSGGNTSQLQRVMWTLGGYGRYYLTTLHPRLHPWVELDVGYTEDTASFVYTGVQSTSGPLLTDVYIKHQGITTALRVGLDWRLAPIFALGPLVGYSRDFAFQGCVDSEPQTDSNNPTSPLPAVNTCKSPLVQTSGYGAFFGGIFAKVTLGAPLR